MNALDNSATVSEFSKQVDNISEDIKNTKISTLSMI